MKNKLLIAIIGLVTIPSLGFSQIDIMPFIGYNFGANVPIYGGEVKVKGSTTYGINLDYNVDSETAIQFSYSFTDSEVLIRDYYHPVYPSTEINFSNVSENYFLLGGVRYFGGDKVQPYGSMNLGMAYYKFTNIESYYQTLGQTDMFRFAIGFGLGAKVMLSEKIGIDMHIRALAPIQWGGVGISAGTGGVSTGAYVGSSFISGDVGGGLVFRIGE